MDDVDFALVNALQLSPRAGWAQLEAVLGVDASTLSRRWARLIESGLVWIAVNYRLFLRLLSAPSPMRRRIGSRPSTIPRPPGNFPRFGCDTGHRPKG